jgi:hypothetical protein
MGQWCVNVFVVGKDHVQICIRVDYLMVILYLCKSKQ